MTRSIPTRIAAALVLALVAGHAGRASACSCMRATVQDSLAEATLVFLGRVSGTEDLRAGERIRSSLDPIRVTMTVERVWKGQLGPTVAVHTAASGASCGFSFVAGERYVVFTNGGPFVSLCGGTQPAARAEATIAALGDGRAPLAVAPPATPTSTKTPQATPAPERYTTCPPGVSTVTERLGGYLDLHRLIGTYDRGCDDCRITRCEIEPRQGPIESRYPDGSMHMQGFYDGGQRQGSWASWYPNGTPFYEGSWRNDRKHGVWHLWRDDGTLQSERTFDDDVPAP